MATEEENHADIPDLARDDFMSAVKHMPDVAAGLAAALFTILGMLGALFGLMGSKPTVVSLRLLFHLLTPYHISLFGCSHYSSLICPSDKKLIYQIKRTAVKVTDKKPVVAKSAAAPVLLAEPVPTNPNAKTVVTETVTVPVVAAEVVAVPVEGEGARKRATRSSKE